MINRYQQFGYFICSVQFHQGLVQIWGDSPIYDHFNGKILIGHRAFWLFNQIHVAPANGILQRVQKMGLLNILDYSSHLLRPKKNMSLGQELKLEACANSMIPPQPHLGTPAEIKGTWDCWLAKKIRTWSECLHQQPAVFGVQLKPLPQSKVPALTHTFPDPKVIS